MTQNQEYLHYSRFIGSLVADGSMAKHEAQILLVEAFWDFERSGLEAHDQDPKQLAAKWRAYVRTPKQEAL